MATYSFKSSGQTQKQKTAEEIQVTLIPYGIKTPLQLGTTEGIFAMNYSLEDQFADNLRNLILTNWGERLGLYKFGANLRTLTSEFVSQENFDNKAIENIRNAVNTWMPFIDLNTFTSVVDRNENKNTGIIKINISYGIPALNIIDKGLQVVLYVI